MQNDSELRSLPPVNDILEDPSIVQFKLPHELIVSVIRMVLNQVRTELKAGMSSFGTNPRLFIIERIKNELQSFITPSLQPLINATGVIIHTNFGRAPLASSVIDSLAGIMPWYTNLEFELTTAERGSRHSHLVRLLRILTKAEAALVVNNNAAAVLLILDTFAKNREVLISRGELVEIGGGFRIPEVMKKSGALLTEVGTTNKTYLNDYVEAIGEHTALIMKVHQSNFRSVGFVHEASLEELVKLGATHKVPVVYDLGSGMIEPLPGIQIDEMTVKEAVQKQASLVCFSADKILGGPQAGIIVGAKEYIQQLEKNHLLRALRIDKLTIAALESTLQLYLNEEKRDTLIPVRFLLLRTQRELKERARRLIRKIHLVNNSQITFSIENSISRMGGGSLPLLELPSIAIAISGVQFDAAAFAQALLSHTPPIIGTIRENKVFLDMRTIFPEQEQLLRSGIQQLITK